MTKPGRARGAQLSRATLLVALLVALLSTLFSGLLTASVATASPPDPVPSKPPETSARPTTTPTDLPTARRRAAALRTKLDDLQARLELSVERAQEAQSALQAATTRDIAGDQHASALDEVQREAAARTGRAVRALYMSGGDTALLASVLDGRSIREVLSRMAVVRDVLGGNLARSQDAAVAYRSADRNRGTAAAASERQVVLTRQADQAQATAAALSTQVQQTLATADATVTRLIEEQRKAAEQAAAARARVALVGWGQVPWTGAVNAPADEVAAVDRAIAAASAAPATPYAVGALSDVRRWLGTPYSAGGGGVNGPTTGWCSDSAPDSGRRGGACLAVGTVGFDCSSLMLRIFATAGLGLPRVSRQQYWAGRHIPLSDLRPGDLLFWSYTPGVPSSIHHVALYLGDGLMAHAPHTTDHVRVAAVYTKGLIGATRPGPS